MKQKPEFEGRRVGWLETKRVIGRSKHRGEQSTNRRYFKYLRYSDTRVSRAQGREGVMGRILGMKAGPGRLGFAQRKSYISHQRGRPSFSRRAK